MKGLTDIPGVRVGHASNHEALTGCTVILCEKGAVAGYDIRGGATGTCEFEVMNPLHVTPTIHAVVLAGGSAFGLEASIVGTFALVMSLVALRAWKIKSPP